MDTETMRKVAGRLYKTLQEQHPKRVDIDELMSTLNRAYNRNEQASETLDPWSELRRNNDAADHVTHIEGSEYVCTRCHRRWDLNDREIPPCTD